MAHRIIDSDQDLAAWYPVPSNEGYFEFSDDGKVRSLPRLVNSPITGGSRKIKGKEMTIQLVKGYPAFLGRNADGKKTTIYIHRLIATLFVSNPDCKPHVNHIDGDKANFCPANLEWVTHAENMAHAHTTGLIPASTIGPGERSPAAKLNWDKVAKRRFLLQQRVTHKNIASMFGVKKGAVGCIARNETWRVSL